jgi:hypothetical protein
MANTNLLLDQPPLHAKVTEENGELNAEWKDWFLNFHNSFKQFFPAYSPAASNTSSVALGTSALTTTQRDALVDVANGTVIYNSTTNAFNFRENGAWVTKS